MIPISTPKQRLPQIQPPFFRYRSLKRWCNDPCPFASPHLQSFEDLLRWYFYGGIQITILLLKLLILCVVLEDLPATTGTLMRDVGKPRGTSFIICLVYFPDFSVYLVTSMTLWTLVKREVARYGQIG